MTIRNLLLGGADATRYRFEIESSRLVIMKIGTAPLSCPFIHPILSLHTLASIEQKQESVNQDSLSF